MADIHEHSDRHWRETHSGPTENSFLLTVEVITPGPERKVVYYRRSVDLMGLALSTATGKAILDQELARMGNYVTSHRDITSKLEEHL